ncbi:hypothetical protein CC1G_04455 [Coprinopsis cinerea okayama7|uniref:Uncharacterized protein n=1 Tax=Coprinopsis cinerea (strain Okayama-7 / 130 / ATCC MYA-4618 / FGSC 9003) TaxID=240176 RepID=A8N573_COPC7|nr:hypothetical protein CC1G_04455 [Coprinopsis cinerea okayama7\|eukprot:XP_001830022.1 hypothetical protein CC1G_04455 [Coprinopsis cinerea okayama7\
MLQGKLHSQEFERLVGFVCMVFGMEELHANMAKDSLHFVGRPVSNRGEGSPDVDNGMFTNTQSPSTKQVRSVAARVNADSYFLESNNNVPIYDAQNAPDFNLSRDLPRLPKALPAWQGEIPYGSFVMVGYTVAVYKSNAGRWTVSCNIQWAIVIGTPVDDE